MPDGASYRVWGGGVERAKFQFNKRRNKQEEKRVRVADRKLLPGEMCAESSLSSKDKDSMAPRLFDTGDVEERALAVGGADLGVSRCWSQIFGPRLWG